MGLKAKLAKFYAKRQAKKVHYWTNNALAVQAKTMKQLVSKASKTQFGKDHNFSSIKTYEEFKKNIPVQDYEGIKHYVEKVVEGEANTLWPRLPLYFCKTSGTTSGVK